MNEEDYCNKIYNEIIELFEITKKSVVHIIILSEYFGAVLDYFARLDIQINYQICENPGYYWIFVKKQDLETKKRLLKN